MSSNYNSRPRAAEVLVDGDRIRVIRERGTYKDLARVEEERTVLGNDAPFAQIGF